MFLFFFLSWLPPLFVVFFRCAIGVTSYPTSFLVSVNVIRWSLSKCSQECQGVINNVTTEPGRCEENGVTEQETACMEPRFLIHMLQVRLLVSQIFITLVFCIMPIGTIIHFQRNYVHAYNGVDVTQFAGMWKNMTGCIMRGAVVHAIITVNN